jgi:hypothetical protein
LSHAPEAGDADVERARRTWHRWDTGGRVTAGGGVMRLLVVGSLLAVLQAAVDYGPDFKPDPRDGGPGAIDVSRYPDPMKRSYEMYAVKCAKCHPLARSVNARFTAQDWKRYMKKMIRRPNSGVNEEQAATIYEFLKYYSSQVGL